MILSISGPMWTIQEFPRKNSKPKRRLQANRAIPCALLCVMRIITLLSWSLFLGLESLLGNLGRLSHGKCCDA